jgi:hypothetical protein
MKRLSGRSRWRVLVTSTFVAFTHAGIGWADIHSNLQVRYHLDEGTLTTANDSSTNTGRNGTLTNQAVFIASGRIGGAVNLPGDNDYINCPAIAATNDATALTVAFWVFLDELENLTQFCTKGQDANNLFVMQASTTGFNGSDDLHVAINKGTGSTNGYVETTENVLKTGQWMHIAVVYDQSQPTPTEKIKIYINGVIAARTSGGTLPPSMHSASNPWSIGYRTDDPTPLGLKGKIDEFYLYTRALSASDIQELYFQSDGSILFNGALANPNAKLENTTADVPAGSNEITICAWVYPIGEGE